MSITVERLGDPPSRLEQVVALHRLNSKTLGFLPAGAFAEYARLGQVIVARDREQVIGYAVYASLGGVRRSFTYALRQLAAGAA